MRIRYLDLGTDKVLVGASIGVDDLMAFGSGQIYPGSNPADEERATPTRNAERIAELEEIVEALTLQVEGLSRQVAVLWKARRKD